MSLGAQGAAGGGDMGAWYSRVVLAEVCGVLLEGEKCLGSMWLGGCNMAYFDVAPGFFEVGQS